MQIAQDVIAILNVLKNIYIYTYIFVLYVNSFVVRDNRLGNAFERNLSDIASISILYIYIYV